MKQLLVSVLVLGAALLGWWRATPGPEPAPEAVEEAPKKPRKKAPSAASPSASSLKMPKAEACLTVDGSDLGDRGMVAAAGLDHGQVKGALDAVLPHALSCGTEGSFRPTFELLIGCNGLMSSVTVSDDDGASPQVLDCIAQVLRHADFPPHDMPDGMVVPYPVSVSF